MTKTEPISYTDDGVLIIDACSDAANADWIRAARLKRKGDNGDSRSTDELDKLENTIMYIRD